MKKVLFTALLILAFAFPTYGADFTLSWTDNSDNEDGFNIEFRQAQSGPFLAIPNSPTAKDVTTVNYASQDNLEYCFRVSAFNAAGISAWSAIACGTPVVVTVPDAPSGTVVVVTTVVVKPSQ